MKSSATVEWTAGVKTFIRDHSPVTLLCPLFSQWTCFSFDTDANQTLAQSFMGSILISSSYFSSSVCVTSSAASLSNLVFTSVMTTSHLVNSFLAVVISALISLKRAIISICMSRKLLEDAPAVSMAIISGAPEQTGLYNACLSHLRNKPPAFTTVFMDDIGKRWYVAMKR